MKAIIVDDNERARIALRSDLEDYCSQVNIIGEADGVESAFVLIQQKQPSLVFLDIKMGDGTGFDLLERLKKANTNGSFNLIFTTAYDEYAIKAFKYAAIDYLLKPIDADDLVAAVHRVEATRQHANASPQLEVLMQYVQKSQPKKLSLPEAERVHIVAIDEILYCRSDKNYTTFFLADKRKITVSKTLKEYEALLANNHFVRVHHSYLVNLYQVNELVKVNGPFLKMADDSEVPVSSRKKDFLYQRLKEL